MGQGKVCDPLPKGEYIRKVVDVNNDEIFNEVTK